MLIDEKIHEEELPKVDQIVDVYSIIAKFLNNIKYSEPIVFPLPVDKFIQLQTKLHEATTGQHFFYNDDTKEFDVTVEGRLFTFIKIVTNDKSN